MRRKLHITNIFDGAESDSLTGDDMRTE